MLKKLIAIVGLATTLGVAAPAFADWHHGPVARPGFGHAGYGHAGYGRGYGVARPGYGYGYGYGRRPGGWEHRRWEHRGYYRHW